MTDSKLRKIDIVGNYALSNDNGAYIPAVEINPNSLLNFLRKRFQLYLILICLVQNYCKI